MVAGAKWKTVRSKNTSRCQERNGSPTGSRMSCGVSGATVGRKFHLEGGRSYVPRRSFSQVSTRFTVLVNGAPLNEKSTLCLRSSAEQSTRFLPAVSGVRFLARALTSIHTDPEAMRKYKREWMRKRREDFFRDKACVRCGNTENLQLDHKNPSEKGCLNRTWRSLVARPVRIRKVESSNLSVLTNIDGKYAINSERGIHAG